MDIQKAILPYVASTLASLFLGLPVVAQEADGAATAVTIDDITINGAQYNSVTISSETPLHFEFSEGPLAPRSCDRSLERASDSHFGRNGQLTDREFEMAKTAWSYFEKRFQPETGLVNAVGSFPSTTLWDTASYISALVAAYELCVIDKREFDTRATKLLNTLRNLDLYRGEAPNKVYNTATGEKVNYANEPGEVGMSALDIGRMLVWLRILKERHPHLANSVDNVPMRWNFCNLVNDDGRMFGSFTHGEGETRYVQEGRLGYEEYAAKGFALWGFDVARAMSPEPLDVHDDLRRQGALRRARPARVQEPELCPDRGLHPRRAGTGLGPSDRSHRGTG